MPHLNKVQLIGHVGREPEIHHWKNGNFLTFSLATSETWRDKLTGEKRTKTDWHNVLVNDEYKINYVSQFVSKGSLVYVEGKLKIDQYTDKSGVERTKPQILLAKMSGSVMVLNGFRESSKTDTDQIDMDNLYDDIPF